MNEQYSTLKRQLADLEKENLTERGATLNPKFPYGNPLILAEIDYDTFSSDEEYKGTLERTVNTILKWKKARNISLKIL